VEVADVPVKAVRPPNGSHRPYRAVNSSMTPPVTDVVPWPQGAGFEGSDAWWAYVVRQPERQRLDLLLALALLDPEIEHLLLERNQALLERFQLSEATCCDLRRWNGADLTDLARYLGSVSPGEVHADDDCNHQRTNGHAGTSCDL
jgi:hypothetical protein